MVHPVSRKKSVALRKESVDRNRNSIRRCLMSVVVALRKESVDRNDEWQVQTGKDSVALRKESVDRNIRLDVSYNIKETSLSARRAWIEM